MFLRRAMPSGLRNIKIKISYVWSRAGQGGSLSVTGYKPKYDARQLKFDGASARAGKDKRPFGANFFCKRGTVMSEKLSPTRRALLATSAAAGVASAFSGYSTPAASSDAIRPFRVDVPEKQLVDLRRRISMTRWPERETVSDQSQGPQLATMQKLARYWATEYDWRKVEARLNAFPNFVTQIDGLDIHFVHVRAKHKNALPLMVTHGWPGSIIEQLKIIDPLINPTAHGASDSDAFDLVIPSMPGYGFSGKPTTTGWGPPRIARAWIVLMKRLGYTKFVAQGGDWGSPVSNEMAKLAPPELLGIHVNLSGVLPPEIAKALQSGDPAPSGLSADEKHAYEQLKLSFAKRRAYALIMGTRPQTLSGLADSRRPRRLAARPR